MGLLLAMMGQTVGFPVPEGGAGRLTQALAERLRARGGEIRTDAEVVRIEVDGGRAVAVRTADGERYAAARAVVADVLAPTLYQRLLDPADVPDRVRTSLRAFDLDPGTVKVDWALDGRVPWLQEPAAAPGTVHVADSVEEMNVALAQVQRRDGARAAVPAGGADDDDRPDPLTPGHRVVLGLHPRAADHDGRRR